jgi:hypothetical protein
MERTVLTAATSVLGKVRTENTPSQCTVMRPRFQRIETHTHYWIDMEIGTRRQTRLDSSQEIGHLQCS